MDPNLRSRSGTATVMAVFILVALVSCSDDSSPKQPRGSGAVSPSQNSGSGGSCPPARDPNLPENAGCVSVASHDDETLTVYASTDEAGHPRQWFAMLAGTGAPARQALGELLDIPRAVGGSDVDLDGRAEWWIKMGDYVGHGAPWAYLNLFFSRGRHLVPLRWNNEPLAINYGGISRLGEGAECRGGRLVLLRAEAQDPRNTRWRASQRTFSIEGTDAVLVRRDESLITIDDYVDPRIRRYFRVRCQGDVFRPF